MTQSALMRKRARANKLIYKGIEIQPPVGEPSKAAMRIIRAIAERGAVEAKTVGADERHSLSAS
jgi:hypothetical protein